MTERPPLRCEQVGADLLAGPTDDVQSRRIATHLATCASCRSLSRTLDRDRARLGRHLDTAEWLPVADRILDALPGRVRSDRTSASPTPQPRMPRRPDRIPDIRPAMDPTVDTPWPAPRRTSPLAASLRAACLIVVGLGLGLAFQQFWPTGQGDDPTVAATELAGTGHPDGALGGQPGTADSAATDAGSAYIPAPGDNPPLVGSGTAGGITASQNRDTWSSVRRTVQGGISPLLYPPVPPGTFDSVVIETMTTDAFAVRYAAEDMSIVMTAGPDARTATVTGEDGSEAIVRGRPATVSTVQTTTPGRGGLRLDGQPSTALAPGTIVEVSWTESDPSQDAAAAASTELPYRVTAAGLPVDVVMTFVDNLAPFGGGWDELRDDLPTGTTIVTPGAMPGGFGAASLVDQSVTGNAAGDDTAVTWTVAYRRMSGALVDRIVFSAAPANGETETETGDLTVLGHAATQAATAATATDPATRSVTWASAGMRYRIDFLGDGLTDADVDTVLGGLSETVVPDADGTAGSVPTQSLGTMTGRAA